MYFLALPAGGGDPDRPGPGSVGEPACRGKSGGREEEEEKEQEHSSPAPVCACDLEKRSRTRLAPKRGSSGNQARLFFTESLQIEQAVASLGLPTLRTVHPSWTQVSGTPGVRLSVRCPQAVATETWFLS